MKRVYLGNKELTTIATVTNGGGGGGDDTQKWVDYFNGTLTEFTVPEGVTSINPSTFVSCTGLTSLTLPSSVTSIGSDNGHGGMEENPFKTLKTMTVKATTPPTFSNSWNIPIPTTISSIYVPKYSANVYKAIDNWDRFADKIHGLPQNETVVTYKDGTTKKFDIKGDLTQTSIENKEAITKVVIGDDVKNIKNEAFADCTGLTSVVISDGVTEIGAMIFQDCSNLKSVTLGTGITELPDKILNNCLSISSVTILSPSKPTIDSLVFFGMKNSGKLYVPSNLLADYQADTNYTSAFKGGIYSIETSMKVTYADNTEKTFTGLIAIKSDTDSNKKNAKNVVIYDTVSLINKEAFDGCSGMTSVVIPDSIINIGERAFYRCSVLTSVVIPGSVKSLGFSAFDGCSSLTSVTISEGVETIGPQAFCNCSSIASIEIPASVTNIRQSAFLYSSALTSVTIKNSTNKLTYSKQAFEVIDSNAKLYVPSNLLSEYQADNKWTGAFKGGIFAIQ